MTVYLDIGAKRIQAYLARTPKLKGRRGASALLEHADLIMATKSAWHAHAQLNTEGKQTDGVLSLTFAQDNVADGVVDEVVTRSAAFLQRLAPGAEWEIRIRRADTYREALRASDAADRAGQELLATGPQRLIPVPAVAAEVPVVRFCEYCGVDPAVLTRQVEPGSTEQTALCADCVRRLGEGGNRTDRRNWGERTAPGGLGAEKALLAAASRQLGRSMRIVTEFTNLAALGGGDANHLCTVFVDGNRFGDLFASLKDSDVSLHDLSTKLAAAVTDALAVATVAVTTSADESLPVVPHLIGGDDLLATVTADRAWDFVLAFLADYHKRTADLAAQYSGLIGRSVPVPTASAGLVFAHAAFPFATALDLAEEALRRAKTAHRAEKPAVCWVDVTEDGPALPDERTAPEIAALNAGRSVLDGLMNLPASGLAQLARVADQPDRVADLARRLGRADVLLPFALPGAPMPLRDALVLGRWWQCRKPA
jgi:hypothetical protein